MENNTIKEGENSSKKWILFSVLFLIVFGFLFYKLKHFYMDDVLPVSKEQKEEVNSVAKEENQEESLVNNEFQKVASFFKNKDSEGLKRYLKEEGLTEDEIQGYLIDNRNPESGNIEENLDSIYDFAFKEIVENSLDNSKKVYEQGEYEDNSKYVELKYSGELKGDNTGDRKEIIHTFDYVNGKIFWSNWGISIKGEGPTVN